MPSDLNYLADFITLILSDEGYELERICDCEEAGDAFVKRSRDFSLIIVNRTFVNCDDGDRFIEFVHEILPDFPCMLLTSILSVTLKRECDMVLYKTFTKNQLIDATVKLIAASEDQPRVES